VIDSTNKTKVKMSLDINKGSKIKIKEIVFDGIEIANLSSKEKKISSKENKISSEINEKYQKIKNLQVLEKIKIY